MLKALSFCSHLTCRVILAQASPVFAAMWSSGASEAVKGEVTIDADPAVATALLQYLYALPMTLPLSQVPELLALADMYEVRLADSHLQTIAAVYTWCSAK